MLMTVRSRIDHVGPLRAHNIREGEPYEVFNGHLIYCLPNDGPLGSAHSAGALVLSASVVLPFVTMIDVGFTWNAGRYLLAPDLSVGLSNPENPGWSVTPPMIAVEYVDDRKEADYLPQKVAALLEFGARSFWVVRLTSPVSVEIHEPQVPSRIMHADGVLTAPGILEGELPVGSLIDPELAMETALRNILAKKNKRSHEEGRIDQAREILRSLLSARGWTLPAPLDARITACTDLPTLMRWLSQIAAASDVEAALR